MFSTPGSGMSKEMWLLSSSPKLVSFSHSSYAWHLLSQFPANIEQHVPVESHFSLYLSSQLLQSGLCLPVLPLLVFPPRPLHQDEVSCLLPTWRLCWEHRSSLWGICGGQLLLKHCECLWSWSGHARSVWILSTVPSYWGALAVPSPRRPELIPHTVQFTSHLIASHSFVLWPKSHSACREGLPKEGLLRRDLRDFAFASPKM